MLKEYRILLFLAIIFGILLRLWNIYSDPSLWMDEAFSAQIAASPLRDLLLAVLRFDTHPPLYYVQLHFWSLLGDGDAWLIMNSTVLDVLVILSLFYVITRIYDTNAGLWVAAIYAILPLNVFFAENVRMYTQFFLLSVWLWYMLERYVQSGSTNGRTRLGVLALGLATTLTHGLGFFVVFFIYMQSMVRAWHIYSNVYGLKPIRLLVLDYIPVALAAVYSLGIGSFRQTEGLASLDLDGIGVHLAISIFGMEFPSPVLSGYLGFLFILVPLLFGARSRNVLLALVFLPFVTLLILSLTVKTVFMYRTLGLFTPFMAISMGIFYSDAWRDRETWKQALSGITLIVLVVAALNSSLLFRKEGYRDVAAIWNDKAEPDAILFTDGVINLWGIARYLPDRPYFSALDIQPPVKEEMLGLKNKLEGSYIDKAGLFGKTNHLSVGQRTIWPYIDSDSLFSLQGYWVLDPSNGKCLRQNDQILQDFSTTGKRLLQCMREEVE